MALWFLINWYLYQRKQAFVFKCTQFRIKNKWLGYEGFLFIISLGLEEYPEFWFKIIKKKYIPILNLNKFPLNVNKDNNVSWFDSYWTYMQSLKYASPSTKYCF